MASGVVRLSHSGAHCRIQETVRERRSKQRAGSFCLLPAQPYVSSPSCTTRVSCHLHTALRLRSVPGVLCAHANGILHREHWSCCGATSQSAPCSAIGSSGGGVDTSNPRSWCKRGAWASRDGKIGKVNMDPDSDSEVKLVWADGNTSGYIKIDRLEYVGEGRHSSHRHTLAPFERRGWFCDVW